MKERSDRANRLEESYLFKEINEQPDVLARLLSMEERDIQGLTNDIQERNITQVVIAARGTSDNAARYAKYLFGAVNGLPVSLATPSLYTVYKRFPRFRDALVLGISQSGKSPDIVSVLREANRQGMLTAAITNIPDSDLAQAGDYVIDLRAGVERSVAATKTYTSELVSIAMLSAELAGDSSMRELLNQVPSFVQKTLEINKQISEIAQRYRYMQYCVVIGRGFNYATAFELALKLKELTYTIVEPYSSADFMHGPLALLEPGFPVIVIAPSGDMIPEMSEFIKTLNQRQAEVIVISDVQDILNQSRVPLKLPVSVPEWLSPVTSIIPGQLFAMHLANVRDYDVDKPRAIRKVTETR